MQEDKNKEDERSREPKGGFLKRLKNLFRQTLGEIILGKKN